MYSPLWPLSIVPLSIVSLLLILAGTQPFSPRIHLGFPFRLPRKKTSLGESLAESYAEDPIRDS